MHRVLAVTIAALGLLAFAAPAEAAPTVYTGQWLCDDRGTIMPLGGIELQLWRRGSPDFLPVEWVGGIDDRGFANPDGTFSLRATDGEDNHFVRMALRDSAGVRLKDWIGINDWSVDSGGSRNNVATQNLGGLLPGGLDRGMIVRFGMNTKGHILCQRFLQQLYAPGFRYR